MEKNKIENIIYEVAMEQLNEYKDELTVGQMKVIADQISRESSRRIELSRGDE
jgi:hypothetical protein